ncbi:MAG: acetoacetate--CoA ligase [Rhizobiales bacterium]|nr:acetoacetate--CoA ligase [Hyphomicrobiales bacterium]
MTDTPLWTPSESRKGAANITRFMSFVSDHGSTVSTFEELHRFSLENNERFWELYWDFAGIKASARGDRITQNPEAMPGARYFPDARLNFAENLLVKADDTVALVFRGEDKVRREWTWAELTGTVSRVQQGLKALGVASADRIGAVVPNMPETIMACLGVASLGGVWSSCSPDFGIQGILDRFGQIEPKVLIACDGYHYAGKTFNIADKIEAVLASLPSVEKVVLIDYIGEAEATAGRIDKAVTLDQFMTGFEPGPIDYAQLPFDHPLYILFSSGTTGVPKCIMHSAGGVLLKVMTEQQLHVGLRPDDRLFYFTTCGWMMWNWLITGLSSGATLLLYDGSPFYPDERAMFDLAVEEGMTIFGTSAKYIDALKKTGWRPCETHDLSKIHTMMSTGSPLAPESFDFVYDGIKSDIHLASVSGGTDIAGCFVASNPLGPVWRGEIQAPCLGMAVDVFDDEGKPMPAGKGELVCTQPFPSMPIGFWNDPGGEKYHNAYFDRFDNIWCHGDFAEWTGNGGMIIHGRSDATLNPGGVRIGTAEIYAQVEKISVVLEALAIGQQWDNDTRIVLFVRLADGVTLDDELEKTIRVQIRTGASPRHVPARIVAVTDIPRTKSGKITELAVRDIVHGREVKNVEALANPEALNLFRDLEKLQS